MADDSDVPPLEDMTEVLKKVDLIREGISQNAECKTSKSSTLKQPAKVNKNIKAHVIRPESEDTVSRKTEENKTQEVPLHPDLSSHKNIPEQSVKPVNSSSSAMFGGMKKGFLFSTSPKTLDTTKVSNENTTKPAAKTKSIKDTELEVKEETEVKSKDDIPYICPKTGKTESGLTIDEVQKAMSETKGLLDNQDWINDDLLNKLEKNEFLLKRFADPHFMKALQEFQTNPQAAMEKYKSNKEVESFLMEFCGLLGDHFSNLGNTPNLDKTSSNPNPVLNTESKHKSNVNAASVPSETLQVKSMKHTPKVVEITNDNPRSNATTPKIVEIKENKSSSKLGQSKSASKSEIIELDLGSRPSDTNDKPLAPIDDQQVKEMLNDPKVMEILLDPQIMNLVQTLKTDPDKAHKIVEKADASLRDKISFLVGKRLLDFQVQ